MLKTNQIYYMDALEFLKQIDEKSVDLVLTDPPYYNRGTKPVYSRKGHTDVITDFGEWDKFEDDDSFLEFMQNIVIEIIRILKDNGSFYIFCNDRYNSFLRKFIRGIDNVKFASTIVWHKYNSPPRFIEKAGFISSKELILFGYKGNSPTFNKPKIFKDMLDVWITAQTGTDEREGHPTQKPLDLIKKMIKISSNLRELVCDPFIGSGTTAVACQHLGRNYIGCDNNMEYIEIANDRLGNSNKKLTEILDF